MQVSFDKLLCKSALFFFFRFSFFPGPRNNKLFGALSPQQLFSADELVSSDLFYFFPRTVFFSLQHRKFPIPFAKQTNPFSGSGNFFPSARE